MLAALGQQHRAICGTFCRSWALQKLPRLVLARISSGDAVTCLRRAEWHQFPGSRQRQARADLCCCRLEPLKFLVESKVSR